MAKIGPTPTPPTPPGGESQGPHSLKGKGAKPFDASPPSRVPDNLGGIMKKDPKLGHAFYNALILGIAMKMMKDMRKHAKLKKD